MQLHRSFVAAIFAVCAQVHAGDAELARLSWLAGCWSSDSAEQGSGEQWTPVFGGTLLGIGRTVKDGKTVSFEYMQIRATKDGGIEFVAQPGGRPPTAFSLLSIGDKSVTFENLKHDFPHRVVYELSGESELRARIEGMKNGTARVIEFPMRRVICDAQIDSPRK